MDQRRFKWASSLEEVLSDFDALQVIISLILADFRLVFKFLCF